MWRPFLLSRYPDALAGTHFVPPVHFKREQYVRHIVPGTGQSALVPQLPSVAAPPVPNMPPAAGQYSLWTLESQATPDLAQDSDVQDDFALNHLLHNLQELGQTRQEPMFVLSEFNYGCYLNQPAHSATITASQLPIPNSLSRKYRRGDFDILTFHRYNAVLIGEVKSVGWNRTPTDADVAKRVGKAAKQLDKSSTMVKHLLHDIAPGLMVRKTIFLPYVSSAQLQRVLSANSQLEQAVRVSLGASDAAKAIRLCLCSDQLSDPDDYRNVTPAVRSQLIAWWQRRMACTVDPLLTDQLYLDIVARFVGPASTVAVHCSTTPRVEVRTEGEAVQELGRRLARLVLTLQQLDLMNRDLPRLYLHGPPGTGKTLLLVLQGLRWLRQGHDVHVVSDRNGTRAIAHLIKYQLEMTVKNDTASYPAPGVVHLHQYHFSTTDLSVAVSDLSSTTTVCVLLDEADFDPSYSVGRHLTKFVTDLTARVPQLYLWAAGIRYVSLPPQLQHKALTTPLRSTPIVQQEVQQGLDKTTGEIHDYSDSGVAAPGDGLRVVRLKHVGAIHTGRWPHQCPQCGIDVAAELRRLGVGQDDKHVAYSDVFVLVGGEALQDEERDDAGQVTSPASGIVRGLRAADVPVCVLEDKPPNRAKWEEKLANTAVAAEDHVTVAVFNFVFGLERKVVVALPGRRQVDDVHGRNDDVVDAHYRILAMSRCTTHLITVT